MNAMPEPHSSDRAVRGVKAALRRSAGTSSRPRCRSPHACSSEISQQYPHHPVFPGLRRCGYRGVLLVGQGQGLVGVNAGGLCRHRARPVRVIGDHGDDDPVLAATDRAGDGDSGRSPRHHLPLPEAGRMKTPHCHRADWNGGRRCDYAGPGDFMGHTCAPAHERGTLMSKTVTTGRRNRQIP